MLEPWNDCSILPPPVRTAPLSSFDIAIIELRDICNNIKSVLSKQSPLHKESALLSRFIYKYDKKFRNDIGYRNFKKVNTALRTYLKLNLLNDVKNFTNALPLKTDIFLPTRQMLEYILVRIMTFLKTMFRICTCSKVAAVFYMDRFKRGESHWMSLMPYALLSRVWSISTVLLEHGCSWYINLYKYLDKLELKGVNFLPDDYKLPLDIEAWIDLKNIDTYGRFEWTEKRCLQVDPNLVEDEEAEVFDSILDYVKEINDEATEDTNSASLPVNTDIKPIKFEIEQQSIDKGETISREYFKSFFNPQSKTKETTHSAENVTNKITLQQFLDKEEEYRNNSDKKSLTNHLSFMQWQSLKSLLMKLAESLGKNRKIERKFQLLWKEKCMDYI